MFFAFPIVVICSCFFMYIVLCECLRYFWFRYLCRYALFLSIFALFFNSLYLSQSDAHLVACSHLRLLTCTTFYLVCVMSIRFFNTILMTFWMTALDQFSILFIYSRICGGASKLMIYLVVLLDCIITLLYGIFSHITISGGEVTRMCLVRPLWLSIVVGIVKSIASLFLLRTLYMWWLIYSHPPCRPDSYTRPFFRQVARRYGGFTLFWLVMNLSHQSLNTFSDLCFTTSKLQLMLLGCMGEYSVHLGIIMICYGCQNYSLRALCTATELGDLNTLPNQIIPLRHDDDDDESVTSTEGTVEVHAAMKGPGRYVKVQHLMLKVRVVENVRVVLHDGFDSMEFGDCSRNEEDSSSSLQFTPSAEETYPME